MTALMSAQSSDRILILIGLTVAVVTVIIALAGLISGLSARRDAAARHATWLTALVCVLLGPAMAIGLDRAGLTLRVAVWTADERTAPAVSRPSGELSDPVRQPARWISEANRPAARVDIPVPDHSHRNVPGAARRFSWRDAASVALLIWLAGALILLARLIAGLVALSVLRARCRPAENPAIVTRLEEVSGELGLRERPRLLASNRLSGPVAVGVFRPAILLPTDLIATRDIDPVSDILIHEAAHVLRRDPLVGLGQRLAGAIFWPHPLVAVLNRALSRAREEVCDNFVLRHGDRFRYSRTLLNLAGGFERLDGSLAAVGLLSTRWRLVDRVAGLLDERRNLMLKAQPFRMLSTAALLLSTGLTVAALRPAAQAAPQNTKATGSGQPAPAEPAKPTAPSTDSGPITENEIAGRVVDEEGKPLEGVLVDAYSWYPGHETNTDKDGRFRLKAFTGPGYDPREGAEMRFSKEGYGPKTFPHGAIKGGTADLNVTLSSKTYFEGRMTTEQEKAVAGALIRASNPSKNAQGFEVGKYWTETRTADDGSYRLYVEPDTFDIQVRMPGTGVVRHTGEAIAANQVRKLNLTLSKGVDFRAKIVDSQTGQPVPGVRLWNWQYLDIEGRADNEGIVHIDDMLPGRFEFQVGDDIPFETKPRFESHGLTRWWSEQCVSEWSRKQLLDEPVRYGKWQRNFDSLDFDLKVGMEPVTIEVEKGVWIRGRVLDPDGKPVAGATVAPALTGSGNSLTGDTRFSVESGPDGRYEMLLPASGARNYNLVVHDGKYLEWRHWANGVIPPFQTKPGQVIENLDISLTRPATVRGRVVDASGKPVANREVRASAADKMENRYYDPTTQKTDADGCFEVKFIRPAKQYIQVGPMWLFAEEAPNGTSQTVELAPGEVKEGIELTAVPEGVQGTPTTIVPTGIPVADDPDARVADAGEDARNIQGTWIVTDLRQVNYKPSQEERDSWKKGAFKIQITGEKFIYPADKSETEYRLNPSKTPKVMSIIMDGRVVAKSIYKLEGDELTICQGRGPVAGGAPEPPADFDIDKAPAGSSPMLFIMKRDTTQPGGDK